MPGLFRVLHRTLGQAAFESAGRRTHQRNNSRNQGFTNMANTVQARKRARQAEVRRQHNASLKSSLRTALKKVKKAIAGGDKAAATKEFKAQQSVIDRIADKKIVHKNTASRNKTRLAQAIKALP
jgi:small subunit ribosomal protein S20